MPKKWENKWICSLTSEEKDYRNFKLKTLGNLAIITQSLNASIRDSYWERKKKGTENKGGLKHYSSGIETLLPYLELEEWNENEIKKRAEYLYKNAIKYWQLEEVIIPNN